MLILLPEKFFMQKIISTASNYIKSGLQQYSLIVHPSVEVTAKINAEKQFFFSRYGHTQKNKPSIAIAHFFAKDMMEETLLRFMQRIFSNHAAFETTLNNYSGFPNGSIYVRVQNQQPFKQLVKDLTTVDNYIHSCECPPIQLISSPHISIANHLPESIYLQAIADYSRKDFHETFTVTEVILLRRNSAFDNCKTVQVFSLFPSSISTHPLFN